VNHRDHYDLEKIARRAMIERGLYPDFPPSVLEETAEIEEVRSFQGDGIRDMRGLPWFSIDNDDTRDLDQLTYSDVESAEILVYVAIADVDALVTQGSDLDRHAGHNTVSVYTPARIFPMLPERLSTGLTSLHEGEDRLAVVVELAVGEDGKVDWVHVFRAAVRNKARLTYDKVAAFLEGHGRLEHGWLEKHLELQDEAAERLRLRRHERGALQFETLRSRPVVENGRVRGIEEDRKNRAKMLIEDFMLAANQATASFLEERGYPSIRRLVRTPKRWPRIVDIAARLGDKLPEEPQPAALSRFLDRRRAADPEGYPELSLSILKLLGSGEYTVDLPGQPAPGHFGLAADDYTHATAPNRRYPDLVTQRMVKAALAGRPSPYEPAALEDLARWCTRKEDDARRVERQVTKSAAALLLADHIGETFDAIVTGASEKGTWVRTCRYPVEGRLTRGHEHLDVGDRLRVKLVSVDVERGFIDFDG
jgi:exoribonuclease-2